MASRSIRSFGTIYPPANQVKIISIKEADPEDVRILSLLERWPHQSKTRVFAIEIKESNLEVHTRFVTGLTPPTFAEAKTLLRLRVNRKS